MKYAFDDGKYRIIVEYKFVSGCASPVGRDMLEDELDKHCKNMVHDCKMLGKVFKSKQRKVG